MKRHVKRHSVTQPKDQSIRLIPLTRGENAIVDASDYEWLMQWNWSTLLLVARGRVLKYAVRYERNRNTKVSMHTILTGYAKTDHRNGNGLDNRRTNLRQATTSENASNGAMRKTNTSGYRGVSWRKHCNQWAAAITVNTITCHLGYFDSAIDAAKVYDEAAIMAFGEFARPNFSQKRTEGQ